MKLELVAKDPTGIS